MLRSYRHFIFALVGCLSLAAQQPEPTASEKQAATNQRIADALTDIARTYDNQAKGAEGAPESRPCNPGDDQRDSDLCAQWKAADAADNAALFGGISIIGIAIAIGLTLQSNGIARDTARRQLRAYINVKDGEMKRRPGGFLLFVELVNAGQTPAYNARIRVGSFAGEYPLKKSRPLLEMTESGGTPVAPTAVVTASSFVPTENVAATWARIQSGDTALYIHGIVSYTDAFGDDRETCFCHAYGGPHGMNNEGLLHAVGDGNTAT